MTDPDEYDDDETLHPDVIEALISIDPYLSDFETGEMVHRDGRPMTPVEHVNILSASRRDTEAAKGYLELKREADAARFDAIQRLRDLTGPYNDGTMTHRQVLPLMPEDERAEAEHLLRQLRPATPRGPLTDEQRDAEYRRLQIADVQARLFLEADHPLLEDGRLVLHPDTGKPILDIRAKGQALGVRFQIQLAINRLLQLTSPPPEIAITGEEAEAKLHALEQRFTPRGPGAGPDADN